MTRLNIRLLGQVHIQLGQVSMQFGPRAVTELFVTLVLAGSKGILREQVAAKLWPDLPQKNARQQLRIALARLRPVLAEYGLADQFELDDDLLAFQGEARVDTLEVKHSRPVREDLVPVLRPFAVGWKPEHWEVETDTLAEDVATLLEAYVLGESPLAEKIDTLKLAATIHPTSSRIASALVGLLTLARRDAEASQTIIGFEEAWVDRFGSADIPKLISPAMAPTRRSSSFAGSRIRLLAVGCALLAVAVAWVVVTIVRDTPMPPVKVIGQYPLVLGDKRLSVAELRMEGAADVEPRNLTVMSDGTIVFQVFYRGRVQQYSYSASYGLIAMSGQRKQVDSLAGRTLWSNDNDTSMTTDYAGVSHVMGGVKDLSGIVPICLQGPDATYFYRVCGHQERDHHRFEVLRDGKEYDLQLPETYQTACVDVLTSKGFYGRYSTGRASGWRYQPFYYDFESRTSTALRCNPLVAVFPSGFVTRPDETTEEDGTYDTHPDKRVLLEDGAGQTKNLSIDGVDHFDKVVPFDDFLAVAQDSKVGKFHYQFVDEEFKVVDAPGFLTRPVRRMLGCEFGRAKALLVQAYDRETDSATFYLVTE